MTVRDDLVEAARLLSEAFVPGEFTYDNCRGVEAVERVVTAYRERAAATPDGPRDEEFMHDEAAMFAGEQYARSLTGTPEEIEIRGQDFAAGFHWRSMLADRHAAVHAAPVGTLPDASALCVECGGGEKIGAHGWRYIAAAGQFGWVPEQRDHPFQPPTPEPVTPEPVSKSDAERAADEAEITDGWERLAFVQGFTVGRRAPTGEPEQVPDLEAATGTARTKIIRHMRHDEFTPCESQYTGLAESNCNCPVREEVAAFEAAVRAESEARLAADVAGALGWDTAAEPHWQSALIQIRMGAAAEEQVRVLTEALDDTERQLERWLAAYDMVQHAVHIEGWNAAADTRAYFEAKNRRASISTEGGEA